MNFIDRYKEFIKKCKGIIPKIQLKGLEESPAINPTITPTPRDWFIETFDWYVGLKLIRGETYGPFYRVDGDFFWPTIGNYYDIYSEEKCFFGLEAPKDNNDVERLYKIQPATDKKYVYEILVKMPRWPVIDDAYIFIGAVKNGDGFQVNPNGRVVELIRKKILNNEINRFFKTRDGKFDYSNSIQYILNTK